MLLVLLAPALQLIDQCVGLIAIGGRDSLEDPEAMSVTRHQHTGAKGAACCSGQNCPEPKLQSLRGSGSGGVDQHDLIAAEWQGGLKGAHLHQVGSLLTQRCQTGRQAFPALFQPRCF